MPTSSPGCTLIATRAPPWLSVHTRLKTPRPQTSPSSPSAPLYVVPCYLILVASYTDAQSVNNYNSLEDNLKWQTAWLAAPGTPGALAQPQGYQQIWNDKGSHGSNDGSVWSAYSPMGYNSSGDLWVWYYSAPPTDAMYVVTNGAHGWWLVASSTHRATECLRQCPEAPQLIYNDRHSGAELALV